MDVGTGAGGTAAAVLGPGTADAATDEEAAAEAAGFGRELALAVGDAAGGFAPPPHAASETAKGDAARDASITSEVVRVSDMGFAPLSSG